jgi:hypothetical protein
MQAVVHQKVVLIDGDEFKINIFAPSRSLKLLARITKLIGEPLMMMAGGKGDRSLAAELLPKAMRALTERMDEQQILNIIQELLASVTYQNKQITLDIDFHGRLGLLTKVLKEVVEAQYVDFFEAVAGMMGEEVPTPQTTA